MLQTRFLFLLPFILIEVFLFLPKRTTDARGLQPIQVIENDFIYPIDTPHIVGGSALDTYNKFKDQRIEQVNRAIKQNTAIKGQQKIIDKQADTIINLIKAQITVPPPPARTNSHNWLYILFHKQN